MSRTVRLRRGTTFEHEMFLGQQGEITMDTDKNTLVVHDGQTMGGFPLRLESQTYDRIRYATFRAAISQRGIPSLGFSAPDNAPTPVSIVDSNGTISAVASFQVSQTVQDHFLLPQDWVPPLGLEILWRANTTVGEVQWSVETLGVPTGSTLADSSFNAPQTILAQLDGSANSFQITTIDQLDITHLDADSECYFRFGRLTDTIAMPVELIMLRFLVRRRGK